MRKHLIAVSALAFALAAGAGAYSANVQANAAEADVWSNFKITNTAVRLGEANSKENPTGLRFKVDCPEKLEGAEFYTTVTLTPAGATESTSADVPATVWRSEGDGWNTVLLAIPDTDYGTVVSATAYVAVNGEVVHTSNTVSSSIAETSATLLAGGATDEALYTFVNAVAGSVEVTETEVTLNQLNKTAQLTLASVEPAGYAVAWKSSNEAVATVDADGNVTAVGNGTATISAYLGSNVYDECTVTAENMAITFSEEEPAEVISTLGTSKDPASAAAAELSVVDFNGGKALGNSEFTSITDVYPLVSYSVLKGYFDAYSTAVAVTFDVYTVDKPSWINAYAYRSTAAQAGNDNIRVDITYKQEQVNGYWKTTAMVTRALFNRLTANVDLYCRLRQAGGIGEVYFDNVGAIVTDYVAESSTFQAAALHPVGSFGSSSYNGMEFASISIDGAEEKTPALKTKKKDAAGSGTTYFYVDGAYLEKVFADEKVTHFQFDIIGDWSGTIANLAIQDNTYTNLQIASGADATAVTVDGASGYYKLTVRYSQAQFETTKANAKYATYGNQVVFRYVYGGNVTTAAYLANFQGVTVYNVLSDTYYQDATISANSETGATVASGKTTFALAFNNDFLRQAFVVKGADSITVKVAATNYTLTDFRLANNQRYCREIVWYDDAGTATYTSKAYIAYEIVDGYAILTFNKANYLNYFNEDGTSNGTVANALTMGVRLCGMYDNAGTETQVPAGTWTISNITYNFAAAE